MNHEHFSASEDVEAVLRRLVGVVCGIEPALIQRDARLVEYGIDSIRALDLVVCLEEAFSIEIPDEVAHRVRTLADLLGYLRARSDRQSAPPR